MCVGVLYVTHLYVIHVVLYNIRLFLVSNREMSKRKKKFTSLGIWQLDNGWKEERCYEVDPICDATMDHLDFVRTHIGSDHIPIRPLGDKYKNLCQVHEFAGVSYTGEPVLYCSACKVNICIDCYRPFHKVKSLMDLKKEMLDKYGLEEKACLGKVDTSTSIDKKQKK